jgi:hypothetical protein
LTTVPAPWCGYTTLSPTSNKPASPCENRLFREEAGGHEAHRHATAMIAETPGKRAVLAV